MNEDLATAATVDRDIIITRVVEAPRELVWQAWTEPERIKQWWGPFGFTTTIDEMDVAPGGVWRFTMHGPDGVDYKNKIVYQEIVPPQMLIYQHSGVDETEHIHFQATVTFKDLGGRTEVMPQTVFESVEERDRVVEEVGAIEGGKQTLARLAEYVEAM
jgi:uncharacterized protein YndB with AHSA1/START domain